MEGNGAFMSIERSLIEYCSPTLAKLKTANLFSYEYSDDNELNSVITSWNNYFKEKGIELIVLRKQNGSALVYICRKNRLELDLNKQGVAEFLADYGYESVNAEYAIDMLKARINGCDCFPHEIGIFLDYPLEDVKGFIENAGANFKCCGCWKVYCNECEAIKLFAKYQKCREVYSRLFYAGTRSIEQLTVKA